MDSCMCLRKTWNHEQSFGFEDTHTHAHMSEHEEL